MELTKCETCGVQEAGSYFYRQGKWFCKEHREPTDSMCPMFEYGHENPADPKGSTAHVRDIKARRWHPTEKRLFYYEPPKTYFFPKG